MADNVLNTDVSKASTPWYKRVSWGAIFAGSVVAIGIQITLSVLGLAIGLASINPFQDPNPGAIATGSIIWLVISGIIALFCGGWVTGRLSGDAVRLDRALNGLVVWGLTAIFSIYLTATSISAVLGGVFGTLGSALSGAAGLVPSAAQMLGDGQSPLAGVQEQAQELIQQAQEASPQERQAIQQDVQTILNAINQILAQGDLSQDMRQQVTSILANHTDMSQQQADSTVNAWINQAQQLAQAVQQRAQAAKAAVAAAATGVFFALVLSGLAAAFGGVLAGNPAWNKP